MKPVNQGHASTLIDPGFQGQIQDQEANRQSVELLDVLLVLAKRKKMLFRLMICSLVVTVAIAIFWPATYTAETRILPPQQSSSILSSLMGQLGPLAGLAGGVGKDLGVKSPADLYVAMLQSRTVADALLSRFHLQDVYHDRNIVDARQDLEDRSRILATKEGVILVAVDDRDPERAAAVANGYVEELFKLNRRLAITEASQRRLFFENELNAEKEKLSAAEVELRKLQENTGLLQLDSQSKVILESVGNLQAKIAAKQVQLQSMRSYSTPDNPDYQRLKNVIAALENQLHKLQVGPREGEGDILVATGRVPSAGMEYVRRLREVKYQETVFEVLAKQFEAAKIDEAKNASVIQVLDHAIAPEKRSKPKRSLVIFVGIFLGGLASILSALSLELWARWNSQNHSDLKTLRELW